MTALKYFIQQELEKIEGEQLKQVFEFSEISIANFEPKQGSEDAGVRPTIIIFHNNTVLLSVFISQLISAVPLFLRLFAFPAVRISSIFGCIVSSNASFGADKTQKFNW